MIEQQQENHCSTIEHTIIQIHRVQLLLCSAINKHIKPFTPLYIGYFCWRLVLFRRSVRLAIINTRSIIPVQSVKLL